MRAMRQLFLFVLPGVILLFMVAPWVGMLIYGYRVPGIAEKCIRMVTVGFIFSGSTIGIYFWKIRKIMRDEIKERERVVSENNC
jgi:hypothetical protein